MSVATVRPLLRLAAAFLRHVYQILAGRSKEQVIGSHAGGIIATMADMLPLWNVSERHLIGQPMRVHIDTLSDGEFAVSEGAPRSGPVPAIAGLVDFRPEAFSDRFNGSH